MGKLNRKNIGHLTGTAVCVVLAASQVGGAELVQTPKAAQTPNETPAAQSLMDLPNETQAKAPVDYGSPATPSPQSRTTKSVVDLAQAAVAATSSAIPAGGASASSGGFFGPAVTWPLNPIHLILLSDGRVMSYGTNASGQQGAMLIYDTWTPALGTGTSSHVVLPNTTMTDIFCGAQELMLSGDVLTSGGDLTVNGARNSANNQTTVFSTSKNTLTSNTAMTYARWYATLLGLPNGQLAVFGGRQNAGALSPVVPAPTPEIYDPGLRTWTSLAGATSTNAFGANWWYPRAFVAPGGNIFVINNTNGRMFYLSTAGTGSITQAKPVAPNGDIGFPTVPFAPGKVLSIRLNQQVVTVDYTTAPPVVSTTDSIDQDRFWSSGTVLADGRVVVTGGSQIANELTGVDYTAEIWDPRTGHWTAGASATKPRLYHSNALLLPDGTVLTGGGGAPGPVNNLNAEIYYPPYLYAANGVPAARPAISSTNAAQYAPGETVVASVGSADVIGRLTLVRTGSATHSNNADQRFIELTFTQTGNVVAATLPGDNTVLVPGYYMLFAINSAGVPSVASIISTTASVPTNFALSPATVPFGTVQTGSASGIQAITLTNNGASIPLSGISFTGPGAAQFSQTNNCGASIVGGATCTIRVSFQPTAAGYTYAKLNVTAGGAAQIANLNGTGSEPFTMSPATVAFGQVKIGAASAQQGITVTNTGNAALPISSITVAGPGASEFSQSSNCTTVAVRSSCIINVAFSPTSTGFQWAKLNVNTPGLAQNSAINGTGMAP